MADDSDLIAAIYDTIIDPSGWDGVVKRIVEATNSGAGMLNTYGAGASHLMPLCNIDPDYGAAYVQTYHKLNPAAAAAATLVPGEVRAQSYITQTDSFRASAIYNEWARPQGLVDSVVTGLLRTSDAGTILVLMRSPDAIWVEPKEWHLLETLAPI